MLPNSDAALPNARGGTPLMHARQTLGIDLPIKALAWEDAQGRSWLSYSDPAWLASRHGLAPATAGVAALRDGLAAVTRAAAMP
ncbi:MAG TPA: DUF302 domain-containing protein [Steroidobacteraceae bacterium]|nr:DUF302 domain-containing protein [Steroidobacteraceae bacterium]